MIIHYDHKPFQFVFLDLYFIHGFALYWLPSKSFHNLSYYLNNYTLYLELKIFINYYYMCSYMCGFLGFHQWSYGFWLVFCIIFMSRCNAICTLQYLQNPVKVKKKIYLCRVCCHWSHKCWLSRLYKFNRILLNLLTSLSWLLVFLSVVETRR